MLPFAVTLMLALVTFLHWEISDIGNSSLATMDRTPNTRHH